MFDTYTMRPATGDMTETACPVEANVAAAPINITLEEADGFRPSATYIMVLALPSIGGAYAFLTASVTDNQGRQILPESPIAIGPDEYFPWTAETSSEVAAPTFSASPPSAASGCVCTNTCSAASDNDCDGPHPTTEPRDNAQGAPTSDDLTLTEPHGSLAIQSLRRRRHRRRVFLLQPRQRLR